MTVHVNGDIDKHSDLNLTLQLVKDDIICEDETILKDINSVHFSL